MGLQKTGVWPRYVPMIFRIIAIDPAHPDAIACLQAYLAELSQAMPYDFSANSFLTDGQAQMRPPVGCFLLAYDLDRPIACVGLRPESGTTAEVKRLWVAASARGAHLGQSMMAAVEAAALGLGMTHLRLDTSRHLPGAIAFYHRLGWTEIARYNDNPHAHHFFEKRIA